MFCVKKNHFRINWNEIDIFLYITFSWHFDNNIIRFYLFVEQVSFFFFFFLSFCQIWWRITSRFSNLFGLYWNGTFCTIVLVVFSFSALTRILTKRMTHTSGGNVTSFVLLNELLVIQVQHFYLKYIFLFTISMFIFETRKKLSNYLCLL